MLEHCVDRRPWRLPVGPSGADDASGQRVVRVLDRLLGRQRIAGCVHVQPSLDLLGAPLERGVAIAFQIDDGEVGALRHAEHAGVHGIRRPCDEHSEQAGSGDDVVVRHHGSVSVDDEAGSDASRTERREVGRVDEGSLRGDAHNRRLDRCDVEVLSRRLGSRRSLVVCDRRRGRRRGGGRGWVGVPITASARRADHRGGCDGEEQPAGTREVAVNHRSGPFVGNSARWVECRSGAGSATAGSSGRSAASLTGVVRCLTTAEQAPPGASRCGRVGRSPRGDR